MLPILDVYRSPLPWTFSWSSLTTKQKGGVAKERGSRMGSQGANPTVVAH